MEPLLSIRNLQVEFKTSRGVLRAVCGVSLDIQRGEIFGIVGETGCGKSVTGLSVMRLVPTPGQITTGEITFDGQNILKKSQSAMRRMRGNEISMIFQNPGTSLNPIFQVGKQLTRVLHHHKRISRRAARDRVMDALSSVGLPDPERVYTAYPHELSGGMQQRVMIAMAVVSEPKLLIADEPTTALDVTIQAQIIRVLRELRDRLDIAIMIITHDMGVVAELCARVAVLYAGRVVEMGYATDVFLNPQHTYTQGLMAAIPSPDRKGQPLQSIPGTVPGNPGAIRGCAFASRCPHVMDRCRVEEPALLPVAREHTCACFLIEEGAYHATR
jgi:peptide/nickel transport system ATP-binding protein